MLWEAEALVSMGYLGISDETATLPLGQQLSSQQEPQLKAHDLSWALHCTRLRERAPPAPVKEVIAADHSQKASGVGNGVKFVVHLFKLLVHDVSGFTLCFTAGTGPAEKMIEKPIRKRLCWASEFSSDVPSHES